MRRVVRISAVLSAFVCSGLGLATAAAHAAQVPTTWCGGTSPSQTDRKPNLLAGNQIDVIYAHASDSPDRFAQFASPIASDVASIDAWWRKQDPTRTPRFDLFPFAGCAATFGKLDLADDTLPQASTSYFSLAPRANRIIGDLVGRPFSAGDSTRKYLIYYDGAVSDVDVCGEGGGLPDLYSSGPSWSIVFVQSCGLNVGDGNDAAHVAAHELLHSLGAVPAGAPHECAPPNNGHVCDSIVDILYPFLSANSVFDNEVLDVNRDDYYGTGGRFDIRNSGWLERLDVPWFALTVAAAGSGAGNVTSDAGAIDCPATSCSSTQEQGTKLTLSATAASGSRFTGWSGACTGNGACTVTLDAAKTVTATFGPETHLLAASVAGKGKVVSSPSGIACPARCSFSFETDAAVSLRAVPAARYAFVGWSGACHAKGLCKLTVSADTTVHAAFKKKK